MPRFLVSAVLAILFPLCIFSQRHIECGYGTILSSEARIIVEALSHDSLQGRRAGEDGGRKAAEYIALSIWARWIPSPPYDYFPSSRMHI